MGITIEQHLLTKLSEECSEVIKEVCKSIIHGLDDYEPNQSLSNKEKIQNELADLLTIVDMLCEHGSLNSAEIFASEKKDAKSEKVLKWMNYSIQNGITKQP